MRLGLTSVRHVGEEFAEKIVFGQPYTSIEDVARRTGATKDVLEALATAGAFDRLLAGIGLTSTSMRQPESPIQGSQLHGVAKRCGLAGAVAQATGAGRLEGIVTGVVAPQLPGMSDKSRPSPTSGATGVAANGHPTSRVRDARRMASLPPRLGSYRARDQGACGRGGDSPPTPSNRGRRYLHGARR
ncbi:MAG: hypothetical protein R2706_01325 [Acidimicrobiales bacterium]